MKQQGRYTGMAMLLLGSFYSSGQSLSPQQEDMEAILIENQGDQLYTMVYPNPGKETVVLLHGGPGFPGNLADVAAMLRARYQVITFHQRGTKKSPCRSGNYSMEAYISDVEAIAAYYGLVQFHLWGHSWGGLYAQVYAQAHPERLLSLFLCCPGSGTGDQWKQTEKEVMRLNRSKCTNWEWAKMGFNNVLGALGSDRAYARLFRQVMKNYNAGFETNSEAEGVDFQNLKAEPINRTRKEILRYPVLKAMPAPSFPITIVYGDQDIYQDSKNYVTGRYPTAQVITIERSGHLPWLHNRERYAAILNAHYSR